MDKRAWIIFASAVVILVTGLVLFSRQGAVNVDSVDQTKIITSDAESKKDNSGIPDQVFGNEKSKVVVIEYGDFSCPGCTALHKNIRPLLDTYKDKIAYVFRNFPLTTIHPNSRVAAAYAEAASYQGKYWEMHDELFNNRDDWWQLSADQRGEKLDGYAQKIGLNMTQLKQDIQRKEVDTKINFDQALGKKSNVTGTPTVYINGTVVELEGNLDSTEAIKKTLNSNLTKVGEQPIN